MYVLYVQSTIDLKVKTSGLTRRGRDQRDRPVTLKEEKHFSERSTQAHRGSNPGRLTVGRGSQAL